MLTTWIPVPPASGWVNDPVQAGSDWVVTPQDDTVSGYYNFYVRGTASGGAFVNS